MTESKDNYKSFLDKIRQDIQKTGFPSEIIVADILSKDQREIWYNVYYIDLDENKGREIDLIGTMPLWTDNGIHIEHSLICSVKKSEKPWIVFSTYDTGLDQPGWTRIHVAEGIDSTILKDIDAKSTTEKFKRFGRSYYTAFRGNNDEIFNSLCSSVKASEAQYQHHLDWLSEEEEEEGEGAHDKAGVIKPDITDKHLYLFEPLVILDGQIFEAYLDDNLELVIKEVKHIPITFGYLSANYRHSENMNSYVVELVTIDYLDKFLRRKKSWIKNIVKSMASGDEKAKKNV